MAIADVIFLTADVICPTVDVVSPPLAVRISLITRSHVLEGMLVLMVIASSLYVNFDGVACQVVFAIFCVLTVSQSTEIGDRTWK